MGLEPLLSVLYCAITTFNWYTVQYLNGYSPVYVPGDDKFVTANGKLFMQNSIGLQSSSHHFYWLHNLPICVAV